MSALEKANPNTKISSLWLILFICISCRHSEQHVDKRQIIINSLYDSPCFTHGRELKDSIKNLNKFLKVSQSIKDSINDISIELYAQTADFCAIDRIILIDHKGEYFVVPYCESNYYHFRDTSLIKKSDLFSDSLRNIIYKLGIKNRKTLLVEVYEQILHCKRLSAGIPSHFEFENSNDSLLASKYLSDPDRLNYEFTDCNNAFWSFLLYGDSLDISIINLKMCRCFNL
jgi:hypothetical protein